MKRWAFGIFAVASMMLCIGFACLWHENIDTDRGIAWSSAWQDGESVRQRTVSAVSSMRVIGFSVRAAEQRGTRLSPPAGESRWFWGTNHSVGALTIFFATGMQPSRFVQPSSGGFGCWYDRGRRHPFSRTAKESFLEFTAPTWFAVLLTAVPPVLWALSGFRRLRIRSRSRRGLCRQCSYDLRASTERCPECGTPIPNQPEQRA